MLCAHHVPGVSGAHNTIVTARAGKDLVSNLVSSLRLLNFAPGLLTICPRFGGATDEAALYFKDTCYRDQRELLQKFARSNSPSVNNMDNAVTWESYKLSKANNLVLNVQ
ncbi:ATP-citrate synthase beta chain protein 2 [Raphanus sativus]|nr:ATP-citrate synthase beta chain protein 2 [Raphanus sativus]